MTLEQILQECATCNYNLLFNKMVLEVEGELRTIGTQIIFSSPELEIRFTKCITLEAIQDAPALNEAIRITYRRFKALIELRSKLLLIIKNAPMGITLPQIQSLAHSYGSYEESQSLLEGLVAVGLVRECAAGSYFPV